MNKTWWLSGGVLLAALAGTAVLAQGGGDRDRQRDRTTQPDRSVPQNRAATQQRERIHAPNRDAVQQQNRVQDRDRLMERDRLEKRDRDQVHEPAYGWRLMTEDERLEHRERMRNLKTDAEREQYRLQHREAMRERARQQGVELPEDTE